MLRDVVCLLGSACVVCLCAVLSIPQVPRTLVPRTCSWSFAGYMPSLWEREWSAHVDEWQDSVCARMDVPREEAWAAMETANDMVFSRMEYVNTCTGERLVESLEPLVGLLRHPYFCTKGEAFLTDKSYMVIPRTVAHRIGLRHAALFFDAGASLYDDGVGGVSTVHSNHTKHNHNITFSIHILLYYNSFRRPFVTYSILLMTCPTQTPINTTDDSILHPPSS